MAQKPESNTPKQRKKRTVSGPKPAFFIVQVLDEAGNPVQFDKSRLRILGIERSADRLLEIVEGGQNPHALYFRVLLPSANAPQEAPATPQLQAA